MSRILLVFHSRTGTARKVALALSNAHDWAIGEIKARRAGTPLLGCIAQALLRLRPAIDYQGPDPGAFDLVVLVSPVWCGTLSGPMRSFLTRYGGAIASHGTLMVMGGRDASGAVLEIERLLRKPALATAALRQADLQGEGCQRAIESFVRRVAPASVPAAGVTARKAA